MLHKIPLPILAIAVALLIVGIYTRFTFHIPGVFTIHFPYPNYGPRLGAGKCGTIEYPDLIVGYLVAILVDPENKKLAVLVTFRGSL